MIKKAFGFIAVFYQLVFINKRSALTFPVNRCRGGIKGGLVNDLGKGGRGVEFVMQVLERIGTTLIEHCDPNSHLSGDSQLIQCYL